ncbi:MAG: winged helix-turn-helix domain-containing protein [Colwellia sp.]|nr:winged helix-turn-helix domain-containing protein [Colwellia sp.]
MDKKVDLTNTPFYLGEYLVLPEQLLLQLHGESVQIDSKIMALLTYFSENSGQVISRDQLIEHVWQGNIVSESSINWAISRMRKVLGDSAAQAKYLKTISKRGYQLTATVSVTNDLEEGVSSALILTKTKIFTTKKWLINSFLILLFLLSAGLYLRYFTDNKIEYNFGSAKLLTSLSGQEDDGRFSPDGSQLLFRHKALEQSNWQLFIQSLADNRKFSEFNNEGEKTGRLLTSHRVLPAQPLLQDSYSYLAAEWSPDSKSIAVVRRNTNKCEMVMLRIDARFEVIQQQAFYQCNKKGWSKLVWHPNGKRLFFTDQQELSDIYQVFEYVIANGKVNTLTIPEINGLGDSFIDIDQRGQNLLILRDIDGVKTQFLSLNLEDKSLNELAAVDSHYYSAYWGGENNVWMNWGNKNVISFTPETRISTPLFSSTLDWNYNTKPYAKFGHAIFTSSSANRRDFFVIEEKNQWLPKIIKSDFNESLPTINAEGELAFISNRSGIPQIWLGEKQQSQLSDVSDYGEFESLQWSNDTRHLLGIRNGYLASIDIKKESLRMHYSGELHPNNAYWSLDDKSIYFTAKSDKKWRLYSIVADDKEQKVVKLSDIDIYKGQPLSANELLFTKPEQQGLWLLDQQTLAARLLLPNFPWQNHWQVVGNAVFYVMKKDKMSVFKRFDVKSQKITTLTTLKENIEPHFAVTADGDKIIAVAYVVKESAIYQIPFSTKK